MFRMAETVNDNMFLINKMLGLYLNIDAFEVMILGDDIHVVIKKYLFDPSDFLKRSHTCALDVVIFIINQ